MARRTRVRLPYLAVNCLLFPALLAVAFTGAPAQTAGEGDGFASEPASAASHEQYRDLSPGIRETRPFRAFAFTATFGSAGMGVEIATPINSKFNLRGGASFFDYTTTFVVDTIPIDGSLHLASTHVTADYFPRGGSFHISAGVTLFNATNYNATIFIPGRQVITLNDTDYTSDPADPIHGTAFLKFGDKVSPRVSIGWGNVIRHRTPHFTFPVELGFQYITPPTALFRLTGSSCDPTGTCDSIQSDPATQQNIDEQQNQIVHDLRLLRFFPIFSLGISYKFGH